MIINSIKPEDLPKKFLYSITWNQTDQTAGPDGQYIHRTNLNGRYKCKLININMTHTLVSTTNRETNFRVSLVSGQLRVGHPEPNNKNIAGTLPQVYGGRPTSSIDFYVISQSGQMYCNYDLGVIEVNGFFDLAMKTALNTAYTFRQASVELELEPVGKEYSITDLMKLPDHIKIPLYTRQILINCAMGLNTIDLRGINPGMYMMRIVQACVITNGSITSPGTIAIHCEQFRLPYTTPALFDSTSLTNSSMRPSNCIYMPIMSSIGCYMDKYEIPIEVNGPLQLSAYNLTAQATLTGGIVLNVEFYPYV